MYKLIGTFTAEEFAKINNMEVEEIKDCSDSRPGAYSLDANTELTVYLFSDDRIAITRVMSSDNKYNEMVDVIVGKAKNWNYKKIKMEV